MGAGLAAGIVVPTVHPAVVQRAVQRFDRFQLLGSEEPGLQPLPPGHYRNPIVAGFHPDPSVCRVGDDFYLVTSSFACFPGLPIHHSRDLVNWRLLGHAIDRPGSLDFTGLGISRGLFAPSLSHHDGCFYLVCTMVGAGGNFLLTARDPAGPWSDPQWLAVDGIDPSLAIDEDGSAWLLNNGPPAAAPRYDGHRAIWMQRFDLENRRLTGPRHVLVDGGADPTTNPVWIEGPHLFRRGAWWYLCAAEGGTSVNHAQVIFRSRSATGPFAPWAGNPILTQRGLDDRVAGAVSCAGHAQLFVGPDDAWWATFLACRPDHHGRWHTGRETFLLPVHWRDDDWPVILPAGQRVPRVLRSPLDVSPSGGSHQEPWVALRGPHADWAKADSDAIVLEPRAGALASRGRPAFLARRVAHRSFSCCACIALPAPGVAAGLALFQSEGQHIRAFLTRQRGGAALAVETHDGGRREIWHDRAEIGSGPTWLKLRCDGESLSVALSPDGTHWRVAEERWPAQMLSVQSAGGGLHFTGLLAGVHAQLEAANG